MQWPSWEIGRALGIPIRVHASWFLVFLFVTSTLATGYLPDTLPGLPTERYWAMGGIAAVLLFVSVLLHELGHSYVALRYRIPIEQITLFIFGGVAHMRREAPSPRAEFLIAVAGPIVSFLLGALSFGLVVLAESIQEPHALKGLIMLGALLAMVNVQLGLFNLIPGFPLDGGRVLRAGLWAWGKDFHRATQQASMVGLAFGVLFGLLGVGVIIGAFSGALPASLVSNGGWIIFIGMFLFAAALASRKQAVLRHSLATVPVRDLMVQAVVSISPDCTVEEAVNRYFRPYGYGGFPVVESGRLVGMLTVSEVQNVPTGLWNWRNVADVMRPVSPSLTVLPDAPVIQAMERMAREGWDRLVVVEDDQIVGLVTQSAIAHFLQLRKGGR
ncbi:site-2 protease family protein [Nitrospira moscoviensis]|uniref:Zinc metalloprotease n=1 Tax=Nitrospira moscoviensis TaxID=42253 RepID=A0A0K2G7N7_NITMO|nr:site-2 protease family protein [Nitrospira moscoviensis]ALA56963.1 putative Membrane-associated zinc metallopeptidase containing CBS domain pair [Nitrospira moscoviensis]